MWPKHRFLLTEAKSIYDAAKEVNGQMEKLQILNAENESDRWSIPWLRMCHCVLEEYALISCKDAHKHAHSKGIDSRHSVAQKKTFLNFVLKN